MTASSAVELSPIILDFLKDNPEAATMTFQDFYEAINEVTPCDRAALAVTVTLLDLQDTVVITKDELGRGRGFALPVEVSPAD